MTTNQKIEKIREFMAKNNVHAYIIPSSDPHMSEYPPERWQTRGYVSGFSGSAGTVVITKKSSALWTDGRYFIQAQRQLAGSEIKLMRMGVKDTPTFAQFIVSDLDDGDTIGLEGMVCPLSMVRELEKNIKDKNLKIADLAFESSLWPERPACPATNAWQHDIQFTGFSAKEKVDILREKLKESAADSMVVIRLDDMAWLLNMRANDIQYNPYVLSFGMLTAGNMQLFSDTSRFEDKLLTSLSAENGFVLNSYENLLQSISAIGKPAVFLVDPANTSYSVYLALKNNSNITITEGDDPIQLMKGVKNSVEIQNIVNAHIKDGCAMVRFQMDLEKAMAAGEKITETDIAEMVRKRRAEQADFVGESFSSIPAYAGNAAMMHYSPTKESAAVLNKSGFLLLDCGGHYLDGTTDITRTYPLGTPTQEEKEYYTLVLTAHINLAMAVFLEGAAGRNLDILARDVFWKKGLDYRCGTGHGIGYLGGVHEGPHNMSSKGSVKFEAGMIITDEPGIYEENKIGIRIENELLCKEAMVTDYGKFLCFEAITYCPIDTSAVIAQELSENQLNWLNNYHETVYDKLKTHLNSEEQAWLKEKCKALHK